MTGFSLPDPHPLDPHLRAFQDIQVFLVWTYVSSAYLFGKIFFVSVYLWFTHTNPPTHKISHLLLISISLFNGQVILTFFQRSKSQRQAWMFLDIIADYVPVVVVLASIHTRHTQVFSRTDIKRAAETVGGQVSTQLILRNVQCSASVSTTCNCLLEGLVFRYPTVCIVWSSTRVQGIAHVGLCDTHHKT